MTSSVLSNNRSSDIIVEDQDLSERTSSQAIETTIVAFWFQLDSKNHKRLKISHFNPVPRGTEALVTMAKELDIKAIRLESTPKSLYPKVDFSSISTRHIL